MKTLDKEQIIKHMKKFKRKCIVCGRSFYSLTNATCSDECYYRNKQRIHYIIKKGIKHEKMCSVQTVNA